MPSRFVPARCSERADWTPEVMDPQFLIQRAPGEGEEVWRFRDSPYRSAYGYRGKPWAEEPCRTEEDRGIQSSQTVKASVHIRRSLTHILILRDTLQRQVLVAGTKAKKKKHTDLGNVSPRCQMDGLLAALSVSDLRSVHVQQPQVPTLRIDTYHPPQVMSP